MFGMTIRDRNRQGYRRDGSLLSSPVKMAQAAPLSKVTTLKLTRDAKRVKHFQDRPGRRLEAQQTLRDLIANPEKKREDRVISNKLRKMKSNTSTASSSSNSSMSAHRSTSTASSSSNSSMSAHRSTSTTTVRTMSTASTAPESPVTPVAHASSALEKKTIAIAISIT